MKVTIKYTTSDSGVVHTLNVAPTLIDGLNSMFRLEADPMATYSGRQIVSITVTGEEVKYVSLLG